MADSNATYSVSVNVDNPDWAAGVVSFRNRYYFISGNNEIFPGKTYSLTLDGSGQGTQVLPTPDNTGDAAVTWHIVLPSGEMPQAAIAYSATAQELSDILAAASTTTDPDTITAALANKQSKDADAVSGNAAMMNDDGEAVDAGTAFTDLETTTGSQAKADAAEAASVPLAGGTLTGPLTLSGAPTVDLHAATKKYVDDNGGGGAWGDITGTLADQTDLQTALDAKYDKTDFSASPTMAEPLKADGSGALVLQDLYLGSTGNLHMNDGTTDYEVLTMNRASFDIEVGVLASGYGNANSTMKFYAAGRNFTIYTYGYSGTFHRPIQLIQDQLYLFGDETKEYSIYGRVKTSTTVRTTANRIAISMPVSTHATRTSLTNFYQSDYGGGTNGVIIGGQRDRSNGWLLRGDTNSAAAISYWCRGDG